MKIGIVPTWPGCEPRKDKKALLAEGIDERKIYTGPDQIEEVFSDKAALAAGDVVCICRPDAIAQKSRQRGRRLAWLADRGVSVQVIGEDDEPVLYDDPVKRGDFLAHAGKRRRADNLKANRSSRGRPPKLGKPPTDEQITAVCGIWYSRAKPAVAVNAAREILGNDTIEAHDIKKLCGPRNGSNKPEGYSE